MLARAVSCGCCLLSFSRLGCLPACVRLADGDYRRCWVCRKCAGFEGVDRRPEIVWVQLEFRSLRVPQFAPVTLRTGLVILSATPVRGSNHLSALPPLGPLGVELAHLFQALAPVLVMSLVVYFALGFKPISRFLVRLALGLPLRARPMSPAQFQADIEELRAVEELPEWPALDVDPADSEASAGSAGGEL